MIWGYPGAGTIAIPPTIPPNNAGCNWTGLDKPGLNYKRNQLVIIYKRRSWTNLDYEIFFMVRGRNRINLLNNCFIYKINKL